MTESQRIETEPNLDPGWFEDRVMELLPDLLGAARSLAGDPSDAEDLAADTVARAWEHRGDLRERGRFRGWIFRILRNVFLSGRRRRQSRPVEVPLSDEEGEDRPFSLFERLHQPFLLWWSNPEEEFLNGILREDLAEAVDALPDSYREVLVLIDVHGFRYAEVAAALEIPVGTVRSRLARGRSRMQEHLWRHAVDRGLREPPRPGQRRPE